MLVTILISLIGAVAFLYLFWKRLKEDYSQNQIFTTAFFILSAVLISFFLSLQFFPRLWFWLAFVFGFLSLLAGIIKFNLRFYESSEAFFLGFLPLLNLIFLNDSIKNSALSSFIFFIIITLLLGLFYFFDTHYKNFTWYRSGKVGFSGLTTAGAFFLIRSILALIFPFMLSFVGKFEALISASVAFIFFFLVFRLANEQKK